MAITVRRLTVDDLEHIPEERPGDRHELIDGELVVSPVPLDKHQAVSSNIVYALESYARQQRTGVVRTAPSGVRLSGDTLVVPDAYFVAHDRIHHLGAKGMQGPPTLVVEILSPGTRRRDLRDKRVLYERFQVPEYWIVDPDERTVLVLSLQDGRYETIPVADDGVMRSHALPELALALEQVFAFVI